MTWRNKEAAQSVLKLIKAISLEKKERNKIKINQISLLDTISYHMPFALRRVAQGGGGLEEAG